jgi:hypothetical protein
MAVTIVLCNLNRLIAAFIDENKYITVTGITTKDILHHATQTIKAFTNLNRILSCLFGIY